MNPKYEFQLIALRELAGDVARLREFVSKQNISIEKLSEYHESSLHKAYIRMQKGPVWTKGTLAAEKQILDFLK